MHVMCPSLYSTQQIHNLPATESSIRFQTKLTILSKINGIFARHVFPDCLLLQTRTLTASKGVMETLMLTERGAP